MPDGLLLLKKIFLEVYSVLIGLFCRKKSLVKRIKARLVNLQIIWLKNNEKSFFFCNFFKLTVFFNLFFLSERKSRLQRLNVINKEIKPFEKEFYNSLNLTNLPQRYLQLNGGDCPGSNLHKWQLSGGNCLGGGQLA